MAGPHPWTEGIDATSLASILKRAVASVDIINARELEQSNVATLAVTIEPENAAESSILLLLLKRTSIAWLQRRFDKSTEKWAINLQSFQNELHFYAHADAGALSAAGCTVPRVFFTQVAHADAPTAATCTAEAAVGGRLRGDSDDNPSFGDIFTAIVEYLPVGDSFCEHRNYDLQQTMQALAWAAAFHAATWRQHGYAAAAPSSIDNVVDAAFPDVLAAGLFRPGAWWRKELRPTVKYHALPHVFRFHCEHLPAYADVGLGTDDDHALMSLLARHSDTVHGWARDGRPTCLVHGDFKTSNIFFPAPGHADKRQLTVIDFQWTGLARSGLCDVAYLLCGGVHHDVFTTSEEALLRHYHQHFAQCLADRGVDAQAIPSLEQVCEWYEEELVVYYSTAMPYLLADLTPSLCVENSQKYGWLTHEYDERVTAWMSKRVVGILARWRDSGKLV